MRIQLPTFLLLGLACLALSGCSTVSVQTTQVTQAAAVVSGPGASSVGVANKASSSSAIPAGEFVPIDNWNVTLVTARNVVRLGEVRNIADAFTYEGRVYAHATFTSRPGTHSGQQEFEARWFNAGRLVSTQKAVYMVSKTPYYLASSTSGTALGAGRCRVEILAGGKLLASKEFVVTER